MAKLALDPNKGSIHDLKLARQNITSITEWLGNQYYIIADSGYKGLDKEFNVLIPKVKSKLHPLTQEQKDHNHAISQKQIIVERFFGRMTMLFRTMANRYRLQVSDYDVWSKLAFALTNYHIVKNPLDNESKTASSQLNLSYDDGSTCNEEEYEEY